MLCAKLSLAFELAFMGSEFRNKNGPSLRSKPMPPTLARCLMRTDARPLLLPTVVSCFAMIAADAWPQHRYYLWGLAACVTGWCLYRSFQEPTNYLSLDVDSIGFRFVLSKGYIQQVNWTDVVDVYFIRMLNPFSNDYETEWEIHTRTGVTTVMVEWPHRKVFLRALEAHVPNFHGKPAEQALSNGDEGRWQCYCVSNAAAGTDVTG